MYRNSFSLVFSLSSHWAHQRLSHSQLPSPSWVLPLIFFCSFSSPNSFAHIPKSTETQKSTQPKINRNPKINPTQNQQKPKNQPNSKSIKNHQETKPKNNTHPPENPDQRSRICRPICCHCCRRVFHCCRRIVHCCRRLEVGGERFVVEERGRAKVKEGRFD